MSTGKLRSNNRGRKRIPRYMLLPFIRYNVFAFCLLLQYILDSEWNRPGDGKWKRIFTPSSTKAIDAHKMLFGEAEGTTKSQFVWHGISLLMMWALAFYSYASRW